MKLMKREHLNSEHLVGRVIQKAVGQDSPSLSSEMSVGFAHYSAKSGNMEPHQHAEEVCYIIDAENGWFRFGPEPNQLGDAIALEKGMILHNPPMEWHVFETDKDGFVDIIFIYGQVSNIRPEENE